MVLAKEVIQEIIANYIELLEILIIGLRKVPYPKAMFLAHMVTINHKLIWIIALAITSVLAIIAAFSSPAIADVFAWYELFPGWIGSFLFPNIKGNYIIDPIASFIVFGVIFIVTYVQTIILMYIIIFIIRKLKSVITANGS